MAETIPKRPCVPSTYPWIWLLITPVSVSGMNRRSVPPDPNLHDTWYHIALNYFYTFHLLWMVSPLRAGTMSHPSYTLCLAQALSKR